MSESGPLILYVLNSHEADVWRTLWQQQVIYSNILIKLVLLVSHRPHLSESIWKDAGPDCKYFPLCIALSCLYYFSLTIIAVTESDTSVEKNLS